MHTAGDNGLPSFKLASFVQTTDITGSTDPSDIGSTNLHTGTGSIPHQRINSSNDALTINGTSESATPDNNLPASKVSAPHHNPCRHYHPTPHPLLSTVHKSEDTKVYNPYNKLTTYQMKQHGGMNRSISLKILLLLSMASLTAPPSVSRTAGIKPIAAQRRSFYYPPWKHQKE
jgi:hypothetical protein